MSKVPIEILPNILDAKKQADTLKQAAVTLAYIREIQVRFKPWSWYVVVTFKLFLDLNNAILCEILLGCFMNLRDDDCNEAKFF